MEKRLARHELRERLERPLKLGGIKKDIALLSVSAVSVIMSLCGFNPFPFDTAWFAIVLCGTPIILEALIGLFTEFDITADVLVSLALIASVAIGEDFAAGEVAFIMQLGALLEELTVSRARAGIEKLVKLTPVTARVIKGGGETIIPATDVKTGDLLRVLPGESIPADGVITSGHTSINQAVMTGESLPADKGEGDDVMSGTVNLSGAFEMRAVKVGEDSSIQRMIRLVQSADAGKAKIVRLADRWAVWIVVTALTASVLAYTFTHEIIRSVTVLVVFCPCALVLATPTAIMAAIGNASKHGFLVKEGDALEKLSEVGIIAFDKTGTLTYGVPEVQSVVSVAGGITSDELWRLAASVESLSEHPLGKAVVRGYKSRAKGGISPATDFEMEAGRGVSAKVEGVRVILGSAKALAARGLDFSEPSAALKAEREGCSVIYAALERSPADGAAQLEAAGFIALSDTLRKESSDMIRRLNELGITPVLLTGDKKEAAEAIAGRVGITRVMSECLPEGKLKAIDSFREELSRENPKASRVCMIGDGINDAPALHHADVGIAMGGVGSDIAVEAADIALVGDEVCELPHLAALSRRMMKTIRVDIIFSMTLNFAAIALAISGLMGPVIGALVHNAGSVLVIINSAFLLRWKKRERRARRESSPSKKDL